MTTVLASKPGLSSTTVLNIPKDWDPTWFRGFINNLLKGADVRNAQGVNGISVTGTIASPYATIGFGAPVTLPGPVTINGTANTVALNVQTGILELNELSNGNQILLNATGTDYGAIGVSAAQTWFLGYANTPATTPTPVLSWSQPGAVVINGGNGAGVQALTVSAGVSQTWSALILNPNSAAGTNYGLLIEAGRNASDYPLYITNYNDTVLLMSVNGAGAVSIPQSQLSVGTIIIAGSYFQTNQASYLMVSGVAFTNHAAAAAGTLTNAPVAGNPTKWVAIDDNGTLRYIPCW